MIVDVLYSVNMYIRFCVKRFELEKCFFVFFVCFLILLIQNFGFWLG